MKAHAMFRLKSIRWITRGTGVQFWEIIADNLKKRVWSLGWVSAVYSNRRTIWIVDAHRDGQRFIVRADEKLTAFVEVEAATRKNSIDSLCRRLPKSGRR